MTVRKPMIENVDYKIILVSLTRLVTYAENPDSKTLKSYNNINFSIIKYAQSINVYVNTSVKNVEIVIYNIVKYIILLNSN